MEWCSRKLSIRLDDIATQADSSVWLQYGNTTVLATVVMDENPKKDGISFIPLSVHYIEKMYSAKRIPGGFVKREGKNQDHEVLISRLIDRSLRPLIADGLQNEVQVIIHVLSYDPEAGSLIPSLLAASIALQRSPVPFKGPLAACHMGLLDGEWVVNPSVANLKKMDTDFIVAGNKTKLIMIEGGASEVSAKNLADMVKQAVKAYQPIIEMMEKLKPVKSTKVAKILKVTPSVKKIVLQSQGDIEKALKITAKHARRKALGDIKKLIALKNPSINVLILQKAFEEIEKDLIMKEIIQKEKRIDGRGLEDIRPIKIEPRILPQLHGSCLFTRGETQVLAALTLGRVDEKQSADELSGFKAYNFMFHYNFLPFCVGEADKLGPASRREIGHGQIAYRALLPMVPDRLYTYRIVSEVLSSNGSSSMASVCAGSLSLMDAGIRLKRHVGGVALGLMKYKNQSKILVDILGDEDHLGLMDLKICGTEKGINALQMDVASPEGLSLTTFNQAIKTGYKAVLKIIEEMKKAKAYPSKTLPDGVPKIEALLLDKNKSRQIFGKKGEMLRDIEKEASVRIDTQDMGRLLISSDQFKNIFAAKKLVHQKISAFEKGTVYDAKIVSTEDNELKLCANGWCQGEADFEKKFKKLKKNDAVKVEFMKLNHKGTPSFKIVSIG